MPGCCCFCGSSVSVCLGMEKSDGGHEMDLAERQRCAARETAGPPHVRNMFSARAILQANGGSEKVCRNLFGEVDHEQLKKYYETEMSNALKEAERTWNFDFVRESPLEGDYLWEKVEDSHQETAVEDGDTRPSLLSVQELGSTESNCCKRKQSLITDYYQVKRRCSPLPSPSRCSP
ncbi:cyclin-dependent kinase inhibitor 1-like [Hyla sarda]|uniref:cyclin-dependent kinase inhibitor 1-like n=1 Tax=Hyla sarda TaxID=327740 RepID=UPI0024C2C42C|nr:cyclin-dependent kinase inhibitor 1-like [Hyla sarda]